MDTLDTVVIGQPLAGFPINSGTHVLASDDADCGLRIVDRGLRKREEYGAVSAGAM